MSATWAFRLAILAALAMLAVGAVMGVTAPACHPLPDGYAPLTAFELARSAADLERLFGGPGDSCRVVLRAQFDHANLLDAAAYIPVYTAFYALMLIGLGRWDKRIGWVGVTIVIIAALADWVEDVCLFQISAAPDAPGVFLPVLVASTNLKWVGLAVATTLGGVMLARRGWWGWLALIPCALPLAASLAALAAPDFGGRFLILAMAAASIVLLIAAIVGAAMKPKAV